MDIEKKKRVRYIGTHSFTINTVGDTSADWTIPQMMYTGLNVPSIMNGSFLYVDNASLGDRVKFQVIHPATQMVLDEFADIFVYPSVELKADTYVADLPAGLIIRLIYTSVDTVNKHIVCNLKRHINIEDL